MKKFLPFIIAGSLALVCFLTVQIRPPTLLKQSAASVPTKETEIITDNEIDDGNRNGNNNQKGSPRDYSGGLLKSKRDKSMSADPSITVSSVSAKPGDDVQVAVQLDNNPGVLGMILTAHFDETSCLLQSVENGDAFSGVLDLTTSKTLNSGGRFVWDGVDISQDNIKDGSVLLMNFSISKDTKEGQYPITLKYLDGDIVDTNLEAVTPLIENGFINVSAI
jgi:hypothetical protein